MIRLVFILDRSFSMQGLESDVIGGFNHYIEEQKKLKDRAKVTTILFDNYHEVLHDNIDLHKIEPLTSKQYFVRGNTALLDAIGKTVNTVNAKVKEKDHVLIIINTDGLENASVEFNNQQIVEMVEHYSEEHDWKFIFLGANIDSFSVGRSLGILYNFNVQNTADGVSANYAAVSNVTSTYRGSKGSCLDTTPLENLDEDLKGNTFKNIL